MTANQVSYNKHLEDKRHNLAAELLGNRQLAETIRANNEIARHNQATEQLTRDQLAQQAAWYAVQGSHFANMDAETRRHNVAMEQEANRANLAKEQEINRSNLAREDISKTQIGFDYTLRNDANLINKRNAATNEMNAATQQRKQYVDEKVSAHKVAQGWGDFGLKGTDMLMKFVMFAGQI